MTWSEGNIWTVEQDIPAGKTIQFKFILKREEGDVIWQPGSDRIIHTWETMNRITVFEDWENAQLQKIIEEDQLAHSNEKYQVDSEMSTFADNSGIEGSQIHAMEKPLAEPDMQHITTDNISSSMEKPMAISSRKNKKKYDPLG
ncbi:Immunoglobulin-like fold [Sesbania bispinosa]|nr:Immunoglobulin-like fold [Sesbania bispinosa]